MDKKEAGPSIRIRAEAIPEEERDQFIEVAETELQSLHEGNFARYRVKPPEFKIWKDGWR